MCYVFDSEWKKKFRILNVFELLFRIIQFIIQIMFNHFMWIKTNSKTPSKTLFKFSPVCSLVCACERRRFIVNDSLDCSSNNCAQLLVYCDVCIKNNRIAKRMTYKWRIHTRLMAVVGCASIVFISMLKFTCFIAILTTYFTELRLPWIIKWC